MLEHVLFMLREASLVLKRRHWTCNEISIERSNDLHTYCGSRCAGYPRIASAASVVKELNFAQGRESYRPGCLALMPRFLFNLTYQFLREFLRDEQLCSRRLSLKHRKHTPSRDHRPKVKRSTGGSARFVARRANPETTRGFEYLFQLRCS